jgi:hypothetical protein
MAESRSEARVGPFGAGRAMAEGVVHQIVNGVVRELDIDSLIKQVDIDALLARIDMDALMERIDIDGIVKRVDIAAILDEIGLDDIVRQSTGVLASDSVKLVRVRTMNGDVVLSRFIDRVLHRSKPRYSALEPALVAEAT